MREPWLMTDDGRTALEELRVSLGRIARQAGENTRSQERHHAMPGQEGLGSIDSVTSYVTF